MRIFPRNIDFFKLFDADVTELKNSVKLIQSLKKNSNITEKAKQMKKIEHKADDITHEIYKSLNLTFITPIDREDISMLTGQIDNVIDELEMAINRLDIYSISPIPKEIFEYIKLVEETILEVISGIQELSHPKNQKKLLQHCENVNMIENKADELHRTTLGKLFNEEKDPIMIMKLREIYDAFENVSDRCEDVANALETIVIKNL